MSGNSMSSDCVDHMAMRSVTEVLVQMLEQHPCGDDGRTRP